MESESRWAKSEDGDNHECTRMDTKAKAENADLCRKKAQKAQKG
jgi:hypothetical protein